MVKTDYICENVFQSNTEEERRQMLTDIFIKLIQYYENSQAASQVLV
ncbi:MAG: hypothetical protein E7L17_06060 [Clostridium sp.]|nr:hypothetical protein [Clostridium sp.]MDU7337662.1 hypothetical protein [Clostridium sp.]